MYKKIFIVLISLIISVSIIGCSGGTTSRTIKTSTTKSSSTSFTTSTSTSTSTSTGQTGAIIVDTILKANTTLNDYLADLAQSNSAKDILAEFYKNFLKTVTYIWDDSTIIEVVSDTQLAWRDFDTWEIAYFVASKDWSHFPDLFNAIFTNTQELVHPASDGNTATYEYTMALRWHIDPRTGGVTTANDNAQRFEAELVK